MYMTNRFLVCCLIPVRIQEMFRLDESNELRSILYHYEHIHFLTAMKCCCWRMQLEIPNAIIPIGSKSVRILIKL